jgi:tetratricopeptide (TPR) repeat protein
MMLETLREFGLECLAASGEREATLRRHAEYYLTLAQITEPKVQSADQVAWLDRLEREHDNLRAVLDWAVEQAAGSNYSPPEACGTDPKAPPSALSPLELGLRLGGVLKFFWLVRGHLREGRERVVRLLSLPRASERTFGRAAASSTVGRLSYRQGDYKTARAYWEESLAIHRELGESQWIARELDNLGFLSFSEGDVDAPRPLLEEALSFSRAVGDKRWTAGALGNLGHVYLRPGEFERARALYEEGLAIRRELGNRHGIAASLRNLARLAHAQGEYQTARSFWEQSLATNREVGNRSWEADSLASLGKVARVTRATWTPRSASARLA